MDILDVLEGDGRNEARRLPGLGDLSVKFVDLLERKTLGLVDHGPHEEDADEAACAPDEENLSTKVGVTGTGVDEVWCSITDSEVEEPIRGCSHGERLCADLEGEDLA